MAIKDFNTLHSEINKLRKEKNAIILAHYYQRPEIQDIADFVGDSFGLSQKAAQTDADVIVFCGVHFMAESAAILSPDKIVILPEPKAGCPMADMADVDSLRELKKKHPDATVVGYVNTTAAVKAECDICCTSANVLKVVNSISNNKIIYVPDKNMADYIAKMTDKTIIPWEGYCYTHDRLTKEEVLKAYEDYPHAKIVVHPECPREVVEVAHEVTGTSGMFKYIEKTDAKTYIIGTEEGLGHALRKQFPDKEFIFPSKNLICANMKANTLEKVYKSLLTLEPVITVDEEIRLKAKKALDRMLEVK
ncbi:quinolinate synthase NadA [Anaerobranca gottschalkii]|uniref:Quinolinate synthase n=1 Tax=Anaerobranca gottschalkii DSM 13577 TaxID=1120990 RepID=A0A1I0AXC4_9FIRM|nr:quinolinate synthase NadA [Anaerobranca gottschalkii]SES98885.1 quinolinate synthetase [Anaerobranca gottschalkii DSM 13577]